MGVFAASPGSAVPPRAGGAPRARTPEVCVKVCVAMSGGVDSSTVAGLLVEAGPEVVGVHLKLHDAPSPGSPAVATAPRAPRPPPSSRTTRAASPPRPGAARGNGRVVLNNKGLPIKQYGPLFSNSVAFEAEEGFSGVTPVITYDPLGRAVRVDLPDGNVRRVKDRQHQALSGATPGPLDGAVLSSGAALLARRCPSLQAVGVCVASAGGTRDGGDTPRWRAEVGVARAEVGAARAASMNRP